VCVGLLLIGLPYAVLWGVLAAILRFVPYVGTWAAALLPIALSLAVFDGWVRPVMVIALFVVVEPLIYFVVEPVLYGHRVGVSEVALLVAVAFWAWLWGPIGLVMAMPLTVCLVVIAKHVPELEFLAVLLSDEVSVDPGAAFYQRLLAWDQDEAGRLVDEYLARHPGERLGDEVIVPALALMRRDRARNRLSDDEVDFIVDATAQTVTDLPEAGPARGPEPAAPGSLAPGVAADMPAVLLQPARDEADRVALGVLAWLLSGEPLRVEILPPRARLPEAVNRLEGAPSRMVLIGAVAPGGLAQARHLCRIMRARAPGVPVLVGFWGDRGGDQLGPLREAGAVLVGETLAATRQHVLAASGLVPAAPDPGLSAPSVSPAPMGTGVAATPDGGPAASDPGLREGADPTVGTSSNMEDVHESRHHGRQVEAVPGQGEGNLGRSHRR
jgi:hypothetical protein